MIPLRDSQPSAGTSYVNFLLIGLSLLFFVRQLSMGPEALVRFFETYGVVPASIPPLSAAFVEGGLWLLTPLVTAIFLHGSWLHLIGNMWFLWIFGDNVEDRLGHGTYLSFYLAGGALANYAHVWVHPLSTVPTVGASGAVAAVLGAYLLAFPRAKVTTLVPFFFFFTVLDLPAVLFLAFWFLFQLVSGLSALGLGAAGGIAWWAHIGGFLIGLAAMAWFGGRKRRARWRR